MKVAHGPLDHAQWRLIALQMVVALGEIRETLQEADLLRREIDAERSQLLKALWPETKP